MELQVNKLCMKTVVVKLSLVIKMLVQSIAACKTVIQIVKWHCIYVLLQHIY